MAGPEQNRIEPSVGAIRRRDFIALAAAVLASGSVRGLAQAATRRPLMAVLLGGSQTTVQGWLGGLPDGLHADGDLGRLPRLAAELASLNPDVIVVASTAAALAAKRAAPSIPIVVAAATNPVRFGLAKDHARPGGNVTGMLAGFDGLAGKQLELGLQLFPGKRQAGMLVNNSNVISGPHQQDAEATAQAKGADLTLVTASRPADLDSAIHELASRRVDFLIVPADAMFLSERRRIAELELSVKLPTVYAFREHAEDGGLMSYGVDLRGQFRRAAAYVDKILRGEKPSDLPFEQTTTFELVINLRTAKGLVVTVPASLLARADEIIE